MKVRWTMSVLLFLSMIATRSAGAQATGGEDDFWRADLAAARVEAKAAGKPLFVIFRCER